MKAGPERLSSGRSWLHLPPRSPGAAANGAGPREPAPPPGATAWEAAEETSSAQGCDGGVQADPGKLRDRVSLAVMEVSPLKIC